jgi:hypothetical protein
VKNETAAVETPGRRAAAYWFADGLPELVFGAVNLLAGAFGMLMNLFVLVTWLKGAYIVALLVFILLLRKDRVILDLIKARLTYPRTGYVRPPADPVPDQGEWLIPVPKSDQPPPDENVSWFKMRTAFVFWTASMIFMGMQSMGAPAGRWLMPALMTAAAAMVWWGVKDEAHHYSWRAVAPIAVAGLAAPLLDLPPRALGYSPLVIGGVWLIAAGIHSRIGYLRASLVEPAMER